MSEATQLKMDSELRPSDDKVQLSGTLIRGLYEAPILISWGDQSFIPEQVQISFSSDGIPVIDRITRKTGYQAFDTDLEMVWDDAVWKVDAVGQAFPVENLDGILQIQDYFLEQADRHGVPIVDNVSFDRSVLQIIRHVTETLRKRGNFDASDLV